MDTTSGRICQEGRQKKDELGPVGPLVCAFRKTLWPDDDRPFKDAAFIPKAHGDIARIEGMTQVAKEAVAASPTIPKSPS